MMDRDLRGEVIEGEVATGLGQGRHFTRLEWARAQFIDKLDIDPFAGTLNVTVAPEFMAVWTRLRAMGGVRIDNPNDGPYDCDARCYRISVEACAPDSARFPAAIVLPEIESYAPGSIEMIAAVGLRAALGIADGDRLRLVIA